MDLEKSELKLEEGSKSSVTSSQAPEKSSKYKFIGHSLKSFASSLRSIGAKVSQETTSQGSSDYSISEQSVPAVPLMSIASFSTTNYSPFAFPVVVYTTTEIQVQIQWKTKYENMKIQQTSSISTVIAEALKKLNLSESNPDMFLLGKQDRQNPSMRLWLESDSLVSSHHLLQGDELLLKDKLEEETLQLIALPSMNVVEIKYKHEHIISEIIQKVQEQLHMENEVCGIYSSRFGHWLDGSKEVIAYELENQNLQFRAIANEFLLRIQLADFDQKIAIKVLPTFTVQDVLSMIGYQLKNRQLRLPREGRYGIYLSSRNEWMMETATIGDYGSLATETLIFRIKHEICNIRVDHMYYLQMLVDSTTTVKDILSLVLINQTVSLQQDYALFSTEAVMMKETDLISGFLKDMSSTDCITLRSRPVPVMIQNANYRDFVWTLDLDTTKPMSRYIPRISRKFGFPEQHFKQFNLEAKPTTPLPINIPLSRLGLQPGSKLEIQWAAPSSAPPPVRRSESVGVQPGYSLDDLVSRLTESQKDGTIECMAGHELTTDLDFAKAFLLTYQSFTTAQELLLKLMDK
ncbi:hypothetical protein HDV03_001976 [Kappamyces sp. JEL0829]|nr:hypothetical protein HDV03_001976 [Kappamyces sp. JEL0829]